MNDRVKPEQPASDEAAWQEIRRQAAQLMTVSRDLEGELRLLQISPTLDQGPIADLSFQLVGYQRCLAELRRTIVVAARLEEQQSPTADQSAAVILTELVKEHDPASVRNQKSTESLVIYFIAEGAPFTCELEGSPARLTLGTRLPRRLARLRLRPQSARRAVLAAVGLMTDAKILDEEFNRTFIIDAVNDDAMALITTPVRQGLLAVAQADVPELVVEDGLASLRWCAELTRDSFRGGVQALAALSRNQPER